MIFTGKITFDQAVSAVNSCSIEGKQLRGTRINMFVTRAVAVGIAIANMAGCGANGSDRVSTDDTTVASQSEALTDATTPVGKWYLTANGSRLELNISQSGGVYSGTIGDEGTTPQSISNVTWDSTGRWLEFRRNGSGFYQWYRLSLTEGVVNGRFSHSASPTKPALTSFSFHATGWSPTHIDGSDIVPRTWQATLNEGYQAVIRIDRNSAGTLVGRLKVYDDGNPSNGVQEELENDLTSISWNGTSLSFTRTGPGLSQVFTGTVSGRSISGTFSDAFGTAAWNGKRSEVTGLD